MLSTRGVGQGKVVKETVSPYAQWKDDVERERGSDCNVEGEE